MPATAVKTLRRHQRRWAEQAGFSVDDSGFLRSVHENLRTPLSAESRAALERGSELRPRIKKPPRLHAAHSSAALVVNVFDYWRGRDVGPLLGVLGIDAQAAVLEFEAPLPTGLAGEPPLADVLLTLVSGERIAIESKFSEWLKRRRPSRSPFKAKYFPAGRELWNERGLPACQALAGDLQRGTERIKYLHAAQLLKQVLGLAGAERPYSLIYLYYDWPGPESAAHAAAIERFAARCGGELRFRALSYQTLFLALSVTAAAPEYLDYLRSRYFPARSS